MQSYPDFERSYCTCNLMLDNNTVSYNVLVQEDFITFSELRKTLVNFVIQYMSFPKMTAQCSTV